MSDTDNLSRTDNLSGTDNQGAGARIELVEVTKTYPGHTEPAVDNVSMTISAGELVVFVGPSGCGKTTTMKMINRLIEPTSGQITVDGQDILSMNPDTLRRQIGYVIQQIGLFPHMTIADNVGIVPRLLGWKAARTQARVDELLDLVGLDPGAYRHRYPRQLSGGQQQRIGVIRALAADPPVMLMDEPFGATDPITRDKLQNEFLRLQRQLRKTIVFVTHDFEEAVKLGDRIAVLKEQSHIAQFDTPDRILAEPADDYVASFVGGSAALKRLGRMTLSDLPLLPAARAADSGPRVRLDATARDALDVLVSSGSDGVGVIDDRGRVVGALDYAALSATLHEASR